MKEDFHNIKKPAEHVMARHQIRLSMIIQLMTQIRQFLNWIYKRSIYVLDQIIFVQSTLSCIHKKHYFMGIV